jgi:hypothetical protein
LEATEAKTKGIYYVFKKEESGREGGRERRKRRLRIFL